jgi:hypothetical protein
MNANSIINDKKSFPITLGEKERNVKFDLNAFIELEDKYGSIDHALKELDKGNIKAIRTILWAGLIHEDETLTEKQIGKWVDFENLQAVAEGLGKGLVAAMPDMEKMRITKELSAAAANAIQPGTAGN